MFTRLTRQQWLIDGVIALVYLAVGIGLNNAAILTLDVQVVLLSVALSLRRASPLLALGIAWAAALFQMYFAHLSPYWQDLPILVIVYAAAAYGDRATRWLGFASIFVGATLGGIFLEWGTNTPTIGVSLNVHSVAQAALTLLRLGFNFLLLVALLGLPWTAGTLVRTRIAARESRRAQASAEQDAVAAERDVIVEQERNRIARDMHDVVAHSLAVVIAQADGARYAHATDPGAVDEALTAISGTARDALADVRLLLGQLRHSQSEGPQPGLGELDRLLDQLRASGLVIDFEAVGLPQSLGTGQQLAVYRIVQEALTNVLRHGDVGREVRVHFRWTHQYLEVTITSALSASPATAELRLGHGLAGMRERAALVGGEFATRMDDHNFVVKTRIPVTIGVKA